MLPRARSERPSSSWDQLEADDRVLLDPAATEFPHPVVPETLLMAGLAFENLLKGILVGRYGALNGKGEFKYATHNLLALARQAALPLTPDEERLLELFRKTIRWGGRYPIPLKADDMLRTRALGLFNTDRALWRGLVAKCRATS